MRRHDVVQDALWRMDASRLSVEQLTALSRAVPEDQERRDLALFLKVHAYSAPAPYTYDASPCFKPPKVLRSFSFSCALILLFSCMLMFTLHGLAAHRHSL